MTSAGSQLPDPQSTSPSHTEPANVNAHGEALLASLIGFFRPTTPSSEITRLCTSAEGQQLLKTLGNFVNVVVNSGVHNVIEEQHDVAPSEVEEHFLEDQPNGTLLATESLWEDEFLLLSDMFDVYALHELPREIIDAVNDHVFNKMPIRLISFDTHGNNCTLVERSELVKTILAHIKADYPSEHKLEQGIRGVRGSPYFFAQKYCSYAILSHTWLRNTPGDILFHDWPNRALPQNTRGNDKITNFCSVAALEHNVRFGWMDTVCINKESSSELDESIRSMYAWYSGADICIAYLADTLEFAEIPKDTWFTRGWTLQELLANQSIHFYNHDWAKLHPDPDFTEHLNNPEFSPLYLIVIPPQIQYQIFVATSITPTELLNFDSYIVPICRIMELAARRKVTRVEDHIYSLMGLLGVNIPTAYGEGPQSALKRMVREIMVSQGNFLALFNHTNEYSILPNAITDYIGHSKTAQFNVFQQDPLVLSHLGVHATFLAIPLFKEGLYMDFPENNSMDYILWSRIWHSGSKKYIALDNRNTSTEWISSLEVPLSARSTVQHFQDKPPFLFLAIFGSNIDQDHNTLRISVGNNVGVPVLPDLLNPTDETIIKSFTDIRPLSPLHSRITRAGPLQINLHYSGPHVEDGILTLTTAEAENMGFKVISAYFR